jgi:serine/threonine-protein phosphatase 2A regulatory subunit A
VVGVQGNQYFQEHLLEIYISAFKDMVSEVRLSATKIFPQLLESVGSDFLLQSIVPQLAQIFDKSTIYQERVNVLHGLEQLASEKASKELLAAMVALAVRGAHDKIPNVKFVASITLEQLCKHADSTVVATQVRYVCSPVLVLHRSLGSRCVN